ncbi:MAG: biopolymer transporter ExbD [Thermoguttaceae bacterium]|nr:biopolymer transporter ExbD [Thermoguttaceae bacterium]
MRLAKSLSTALVEMDMTPMIDVTFQLIIFFMLAISFAEADQDQRIKLPLSELAKPPEGQLETPLTLQLTDQRTIIFGAQEVTLDRLKPLLEVEWELLSRRRKTEPRDATIVLRGDRDAPVGEVQQMMRICQEVGFEQFILRARQEQPQ